MGNETIQDTSFFNEKREKQGGKTGKQGKNTIKQEKTGGKKGEKKTENYKKYRNKILTRFREMLKTETSFRWDFGKCWKRKRKRGLLQCHKTTIQEQKRCIVPPYTALRIFNSCSDYQNQKVHLGPTLPLCKVWGPKHFLSKVWGLTQTLVKCESSSSVVWTNCRLPPVLCCLLNITQLPMDCDGLSASCGAQSPSLRPFDYMDVVLIIYYILFVPITLFESFLLFMLFILFMIILLFLLFLLLMLFMLLLAIFLSDVRAHEKCS